MSAMVEHDQCLSQNDDYQRMKTATPTDAAKTSIAMQPLNTLRIVGTVIAILATIIVKYAVAVSVMEDGFLPIAWCFDGVQQ